MTNDRREKLAYNHDEFRALASAETTTQQFKSVIKISHKYRIVIQNNRVYKISVQLNALKLLTQVAKNETNLKLYCHPK
ncbi:UNVERIFIED_CONTAM: hypothetical protein NCL1_02682 [Trichonephila clavipes]